MNKLDGYICYVPFEAIEMHQSKRFLCCASWLTEFLPDDMTVKEAWESDTANKSAKACLMDLILIVVHCVSIFERDST